MTLTKQERAASELLALAAELGVNLPMPIEEIVRLEEQGATVDLLTGEVTPSGADERVTVTEAALALIESEGL